MKKVAAAVAVLALAGGGYYLSQQSSSPSISSPMLDYIPADTLLFSGQMTPFPLKDYLNTASIKAGEYPSDLLGDINELTSPQEKFFFSLYQQYLTLAGNPEKFLSHYGLPDTMQSYTYTLGALPVMKTEIADAAAFWAELDRAEVESGFKHTVKSIAGVEYRAYPLSDDGEQQIDMVVAIENGWVTITLNTTLNKPELLEIALGKKAVDNPLSKSPLLGDIIKQHGFTNDSVSFINHIELAKGITTADGNMFAKQISQLAGMLNEDPFAEFRSPVCHDEIMGIANNWPRTVMGFKSLNITPQKSEFDAEVVIETKNAPILNALSKMRGFIPDFGKDADKHIFSLGLGLDVGQLAPSLNAIWKDLQTPSYQCAPLAQSQYALQESNPAMIGMMTGMANGVKGMSVTVANYELQDDPASMIKSLDALVTFTTESPGLILGMLSPMYPPLAQLDLKEDGTPVDVTPLLMLPPGFGINAQMAIKGKHLTLFSGEESQKLADKLSSQAPTANGLVDATIDYQKALSPMLTFIEQSGEEVPEELEMMKGYNMKFNTSIDINEHGIVIGSKMDSTAK